MKTMILSVMLMGLVQSAHADLAYLQMSCDANGAKEVMQITMSGVTFFQAKLQAEGVGAYVSRGEVSLTANDGTTILLGSVITSSACGFDGTLAAQALLVTGVQVQKSVSIETACYASTTDGDYAADQAYRLNLTSGSASLLLTNAYATDYSSAEACQAATKLL
jgi:hypothetical protein